MIARIVEARALVSLALLAAILAITLTLFGCQMPLR
jgi:hypothetical protein